MRDKRQQYLDEGMTITDYQTKLANNVSKKPNYPEERAYFNALPTNFNLPPEAIDRLREVGARLLRNSPDFQRLLRDLPTLR